MVSRSSSPWRRLFLFERVCELLQLGVVKGTRLRRREKQASKAATIGRSSGPIIT